MRIGVPRRPARGRACGGPRKRNTKEKANLRGARGALHAKASGRDRAITARASTSRLSCQSMGGRRLVALLCRGTLSRKHSRRKEHLFLFLVAACNASRRRQPRQAYHRFRSKKGSQPWRRRWLSFDAELPSWRGAPRARPHPAHRHRALLGCLIEGHCRARPQAEASRGLIPWLPFALWTPWMAPVGLSLAGYIMHNLRF